MCRASRAPDQAPTQLHPCISFYHAQPKRSRSASGPRSMRQLAQHPFQIVEPLAGEHTDLINNQHLDELRPELLAEALVHAAEVLLALGHADARRRVDRRAVHVRRGDARRRADGDLLRVSVWKLISEFMFVPKFDFHTDESWSP